MLMKNLIKSLKQIKLLRSCVYFLVGVVSYPGIAIINRLQISGTEHIKDLPKRNVLFVSNHQTYFADVITFLHIFCAIKWRKQNKLGIPFYLLNPFTKVYYVAAAETMKSTWLSRFLARGGAIAVKRTWIPDNNEVLRGLDSGDARKIGIALKDNWVITFPQGTTKPFVKGRKGTAFIIKHYKPIVVPIVIDGFSKAFDKKGLKLKKKGTLLSVQFKEPLRLTYEETVDEILDKVMDAIEQSEVYKIKEQIG